MNKIKIALLFAFTLFFLSCKKITFASSPNAEPVAKVTGNGNITLVLEAGMGNWSLFYEPIVQQLSTKYTVVTIDRAGYSNSLVPDTNRDAYTLATELKEVLTARNLLNDTVVFVGHSFGGTIVRAYQNLYPADVSGLILLDASHPSQFTELPARFNELKENQKVSMSKLIKTAEKGWLKSKQGKKRIPTFNLPESLLEEYYLITTNPQYYATFHKEVTSFDESLLQIKSIPTLGSLPLLVLASEKSMDETTILGLENYPFEQHNETWLKLQNELALLSDNSLFVSTSKSNHYLTIFEPQWVIDQINLFITTKIQ